MTTPTHNPQKLMHDLWKTKNSAPNQDSSDLIQEVMHDELLMKTKKFDSANDLHEKIRNDEDYDDWEYGTEPIYGKCNKYM